MRGRRASTLGTAAALAAVAALVLAPSGAAGRGSLASFFFGPNLVRAEVILKQGGRIHDYRVDRGRIETVGTDSLALHERDGTEVTVPVAAGAEIRLGRRTVRLQRLRRGFVATTVRDGDAAASIVRATRR